MYTHTRRASNSFYHLRGVEMLRITPAKFIGRHGGYEPPNPMWSAAIRMSYTDMRFLGAGEAWACTRNIAKADHDLIESASTPWPAQIVQFAKSKK